VDKWKMISFWNQARNVGSFTVKKCFFSDQSSTKNQAIFDSVVNRAFRHVYFRTLPLRRQPELKGREKEICDNIETEARVYELRVYYKVLDIDNNRQFMLEA